MEHQTATAYQVLRIEGSAYECSRPCEKDCFFVCATERSSSPDSLAAMSSLQQQKALRLQEARLLMLTAMVNAGAAGPQYVNVSQKMTAAPRHR